MSVEPPVCPYCGGDAELLLNSAEVYRGRDYGPIWLCRPCEARVGTHTNDNGHKPLGSLANAELRAARRRAHAAFDPLWRRKMARDGCSKRQARKAAYSWLSLAVGISFQECHIGRFDVEQCEQVVKICAPYARLLDKEQNWPGNLPEAGKE